MIGILLFHYYNTKKQTGERKKMDLLNRPAFSKQMCFSKYANIESKYA